ncbi:MAG TPA: PAS domain-containing protein [Micropepsaceae bacterium]|nr:PAS domain-containing protein [Micropepsaceae bacterium]
MLAFSHIGGHSADGIKVLNHCVNGSATRKLISGRDTAMAQDPSLLSGLSEADYKLVFEHMPGLCLVLDTRFRIVAQNAMHAKATLSADRNIVGKGLFEVFPDNPDDSRASGVSAVRQSLLKVMETRQQDTMPVIRYDVQPRSGTFQLRYWAITNTPILGEDGFVRWIVNRAEDVTELVQLRRREHNVDFCRKHAKESKGSAAKAATEEDRKAFLKMAADWDKLADEMEAGALVDR